MTYIPYGRQLISEADIDAVVSVLKSDFLTQGPAVPQFEEAIAEYVDAPYSVAVNSATSALHIACRALGLKEGDYLWTSPITFVASANCALYCGAQVDFVDIDPLTYNMSVEALEQKLIKARAEGKLPKVVVPVHLCGQSCDMGAIRALADAYGFAVIEDASHAIGGQYEGRPIGGCQFSDISVFSFHPVKIVTTGEGGVATTSNAKLAEKMRLLRSHGITRDESLMQYGSQDQWYYEQIELGYNYRMTDIQAALGTSQLKQLDEFVCERNRLAQRYDQQLETLPLTIPYQAENSYSARHLYVIRLKLDEAALSHSQVFSALREKGIGVNLHYIPVYKQPYYRELGFFDSDFPEAERYYKEAISLPLFPSLSNQHQDTVVTNLSELLL